VVIRLNNKFYISDLHIGHKNVISLDNRPFKNLDEMHEEITKRWNNVVDKSDHVYLLGDILWDNTYVNVLHGLNGFKHLVRGNHDGLNKAFMDCFVSITEYEKVKDDNKTIILCHYPIPCYDGSYDGRKLMFYGHTHFTPENDMIVDFIRRNRSEHFPMKIYNVGCMMPWMDYTPRTACEIMQNGGVK
jgi:calcineurin-like phosphoesterase family protein